MSKVKYVIASDHAAIEMKSEIIEYIKELNLDIEDLGPFNKDRVDYPDYADKVCEKVQSDENTLGILICGTGIGMSIASNKHKGIRSALCSEPLSASFAKEHNDSNVICMGARTIGGELAKSIVKSWIDSSFQGGRHLDRVKKFRD